MTKKNNKQQKQRNQTNDGKATNTDVAKIYREHRASLKGYISKQLSYSDESEDLLQDVFYQLSKIDLEENPIRNISAWLYTVANNKIIDRARVKREESMPQIDGGSDDDDFLFDLSEFLSNPDDTPDIQYLHSLVWNELDIALSELPKEQRVVYELTEFDGFSYKEISDSTDIPINTLISRKRYAVLHLRDRLEEIYEDIKAIKQ